MDTGDARIEMNLKHNRDTTIFKDMVRSIPGISMSFYYLTIKERVNSALKK